MPFGAYMRYRYRGTPSAAAVATMAAALIKATSSALCRTMTAF
jgi:hypothetical protein